MNAGEKYEYHWCDGIQYKKPVCIPALEYMQNLMLWCGQTLSSLSLQPLPVQLATFKVIFKRLFRVYAHIYYAHFDQIVQLELEAHFNTSFRHFMLFVQEFSLIEPKELAPLAQLAEKLCK
jgi:MOB kinase activator 1